MSPVNAPIAQSGPSRKGRGWAIAALIVSFLAVVAIIGVAGVGVLWAGTSVMTGAPEIVVLSIAQSVYRVGLFFVIPLAVITLILAIIALMRTSKGSGRGFAIAALVIAAVCLLASGAGLPLLQVEPCFDAMCAESRG